MGVAVTPLAALATFAACAPKAATQTALHGSRAPEPAHASQASTLSPTPEAGVSSAGGSIDGGVVRNDFDPDFDVPRPDRFLAGVARQGRLDGTPREEEAARDLDDALRECRIFRQIIVGALPQTPLRLTWVLLRGRERVKLHLFCQTGHARVQSGQKWWLGLDGTEQLESTWSRPVRVTFEGAAGASGTGMHLATTMDLGEMWACVSVVRSVVLTCAPGHLSALRAGAVLVAGPEQGTWAWRPAVTENVEGLSCALSREAGDAGRSTEAIGDMGSDKPLVFAPPKNGSPGVEWVYENSDEVVQKGAYRRMPVTP
jgi:hypothetical protein